MTNPEIEGVYESKIPLIFNFIVQNGSLIKLNKTSNRPSNYLTHTFSLEDFHPIFTPEKPYLNDFECQKIYITQLTLRNKEVWGIINPINGIYDFILVHKNIDVNNYNGIIREIIKNDPIFQSIERPKIKVKKNKN